MLRRVALVVLLVVPAAVAQEPRPAGEPEWTPVGIAVTRPDPAEDERPGLARDRGVNTTLTAQLQLPGRIILAVDPTQCAVDRFTDDRNTNLYDAPQVRLSFARVTATAPPAHGKAIRVTFRAPGHPAAGATKLRVKGEVGVVVGKDEKTVERKDVSVRKGVDLGAGTLKALDSGLARDVAPTGVKYTGTRPLKRLALVDRAGEEVEAVRNPFTEARTAGAAAKGEFSMLYSWPRAAPDPCTVRATYFDRVELVVVPVDLEAGLGL